MGKKKVIQKTEEDSLKNDKAAIQAVGAKKADISGKRLIRGRVYIRASYNNTVITATDEIGNVMAWSSAGALGFSGPKKSTPFAASKVVAVIAEKLRKIGLVDIDVLVGGVGGGRDSSVRSLGNQGFNILSIKDITPIPHNGPRPRKIRRV